jgi:hypothetical protein
LATAGGSDPLSYQWLFQGNQWRSNDAQVMLTRLQTNNLRVTA